MPTFFLGHQSYHFKTKRSSKTYLERTYQLNFLFHLINDTFVMVSFALVDSGRGHQTISAKCSSILLTLQEFLFARVYFLYKGPHVLQGYSIWKLFLLFFFVMPVKCDVLYYLNKHGLLISTSRCHNNPTSFPISR